MYNYLRQPQLQILLLLLQLCQIQLGLLDHSLLQSYYKGQITYKKNKVKSNTEGWAKSEEVKDIGCQETM